MKETRRTNLSLITIALLSISAYADAEVVTWEVTGSLISVDTSGGFITEFPSAVVGSPYTFSFSFETTSAVSGVQAGETGVRYRYFNALESVNLTINGESLDRSQQGFQSIDIWDDFSFSFSGNPAADGFNVIWGVESPQNSGFSQLALILRGSDDLTVFTGPALPDAPPVGLTSFSTQVVQLVDGSDGILGSVASISVKLPTPSELLSELVQQVLSLNLRTGIENGFDSKLQNALAALDRANNGDVASATAILVAFIHSVEAQSGKALTVDQADQLILSAQSVIDSLTSP